MYAAVLSPEGFGAGPAEAGRIVAFIAASLSPLRAIYAVSSP
jgi:hypothetical protein